MHTLGLVVWSLGAIGLITLMVVAPLTAPPTHEVTMSTMTSLGVPPAEDYHYMETVCPCRAPSQWKPATDERDLSNLYFDQHTGEMVNDPRHLSALAVFWGQFVDHTIVRSVEDEDQTPFILPFDSEINMTITRLAFRPATRHPECREPETEMSPFLDGSAVYSDYVDPSRLDALRVSSGSCRLKTSRGFQGEDMPPIVDNHYYCGDTRCPEHVVLTALHTLWLREHNRLCGVLETLYPSREWTGTQRFYKARDMVIWKQQKITYEDWLPLVFGSQAHLLEDIDTKGTGARMTTEFATAAYRWHSMVPNQVGPWPLINLFFNPTLLQTQGVTSVLQHAYHEPASRADLKVVDGLRNTLFGMFGMDLMARNLVRAREVGIGSYAQLCACYNVATQHQFEDPLLGMLAEPLEPGSSLPRLMAHICAEQFKRIRVHDDNFWSTQLPHMKPEIRAEILNTNLATLLKMHANVNIPANKNAFLL